MAWYIVLPKIFTCDGNYKDPKGGGFTEEQQLLRKGVITLYKAILLLLTRVVCSQITDLNRQAIAEADQDSPPADDILSEADIVTAEKSLACFRGQNIESHIRRLVEASTNEHPDVLRIEKQELKETQALLKNFDAIDTQQSVADLISQKLMTLKPLYEWVCSTPEYIKFDEGDARVLLVSGVEGAGTTMLMLAIIRGLTQRIVDGSDLGLMSYSFCSNGQRRPENAASVVKSLIYFVLQDQPWLGKHLDKRRDLTGIKHFADVDDLYALSLLLYGIIQDEDFRDTLFIIDGIDECVAEGLDSFLSLINTTMRLSPRIKWLASVRSSKSGVVSTSFGLVTQSHLHVNSGHVEIGKIFENYYIPSKVDELAQHGSFKGKFRAEVTAKLLRSSASNFLWADIACEAIKLDDSWHALHSLDMLAPDKKIDVHLPCLDIPTHIKDLYLCMKRRIEELDEQDRKYCFRVLLAMAIAFRPLTITELEAAVDLPSQIDLGILVRKRCFAFLESRNGTLYFTHHSAREFIRQDMSDRITHAHSRVVQRCLLSLSRSWNKPARDPQGKRREDLATFPDYAAVYWIRHLHDAEGIEQEDVVRLFSDFPLQWINLLVLKNRLSQACQLLRELELVLKEKFSTKPYDLNASHTEGFLGLIREMHRLLQLHRLTQSPAEVKAKNSLLFCPSNSIIRQRLIAREYPELTAPPFMEQRWSNVVHTMRGHSDYVRCCAYSYDGKLLASASDDGSVRIWNTITGKAQYVFEQFSGWVYRVAFSSQGLLAASDCNIIKIWDVATGMLQKLLDEENLSVVSMETVDDISFSDDGSMLVAVGDSTIIIWMLPSFDVIVRQRTTFRTTYARFSSDGTLLGTVLEDRVVIWKLESDKEDEVKTMHLRELQAQVVNDSEKETVYGIGGITFSPDSRFLAIGTRGGISGTETVRIWDWESDRPPAILSGHTDDINMVSFSPDGSLLASASDDQTVRIWKTPWNGEPKQPTPILRGHSRSVKGLSFSPTGQKHLATCSSDRTLRIWEYDNFEAEIEPESSIKADEETDRLAQLRTISISLLASSNDGKLIASASTNDLIRIWDGNSGAVLRDLQGHDDTVRSLLFSSDSKRLISASDDKTVRIWDTVGKAEVRILYGHTDWVRSAIWSPDGRLVISGSDDATVRVWDITCSDVGKSADLSSDEEEKQGDTDGIRVLRGHQDYVISVTCSNDGKYVAAGSDNGVVLLWELSTDHPSASHEPKAMKDSERSRVSAVAFVPHASELIASDSDENLKIWNTKTCELIRKVNVGRSLYYLQVSPAVPGYLITEFGPIPMEYPVLSPMQIKPTTQNPHGLAFYSEEHWIIWKEKKTIFLPERYRPMHSRSVLVQGCKVVIGNDSSRISIFNFK
ncbi:MAG: hypothetical protein Q9190_004551 [Brigantiaea leucoxantha]